MEEAVRTLKKWIEGSGSIVFFGGAGVSTESGIPDFRSVDGLYSQKNDEPPEAIVSHAYLEKWPEKFFRFYREKMIYPEAVPNGCHLGLAKLERMGKLKAVITQNIDGLHQAAGSREVLELHGSVHRNYCVSCGKRYGLDYVLKSDGVPRCSCGGLVRPDVVLYGERLDEELLEKAVGYIRRAELLIVGGTSLTVQPAAGLINYYRGDRLVLINKAPTQYDRFMDLTITENIGKVFEYCTA